MQSLTHDHARRVIEKYFKLFTSIEYKHLNVTDVQASPSTKQHSKAIIQVVTQNGNREDLDNFCLRNDIEYDIK